MAMVRKKYVQYSLFLLGVMVFATLFWLPLPRVFSSTASNDDPFEAGKLTGVHYNYQLFDPEEAPQEMKPLVMRGYQLLLETGKLLPEYVGDQLSCRNCHFSAGNTFGGRRNGLSLVGVSHQYPKKLSSGKEYSLAERINGCFLRSMNGKQLPLDGEEMQAMVAYLKWISQGIPKLPAYPWLGVSEIRTHHTPNPQHGEKIYQTRCALCHGKEGAGQQRPDGLSYPPLWGNGAFNDAAGMHKLHTFAYFVYQNMPYDNPVLTYEEALDVASFVTKQPRPHFNTQK